MDDAARDALLGLIKGVEAFKWGFDHGTGVPDIKADEWRPDLLVSVDDIVQLYRTQKPFYVIPPQDYNRIELFTMDHYLMSTVTDANPLGLFHTVGKTVRSGSGSDAWLKVSGNELAWLRRYQNTLDQWIALYAKGKTHTK